MGRCKGYEKYECVDGSCGFSEYSCRRSQSKTDKCNHYQYDYLCLNGECAKSDAGCLRPCGMRVNGEIYQYPCPGFTGCRASNGHDCPSVCSGLKPFKCANQDCVKNEKYCQRCYGFRCDNGDCTYSYMDRCNGRVDCTDGSDESANTCSTVSRSFSGSSMISAVIMPMLIIFVIIVLVITIVLVRRRRLGQAGVIRARRGGPAVVTSGVPVQQMQPLNQHGPNPYQPPHPYGQQAANPYSPPYNQPGYNYPYQPMPQHYGGGGGSYPSAPYGQPNIPPYPGVGPYGPPDPYGASAALAHDAPPSYHDVVK